MPEIKQQEGPEHERELSHGGRGDTEVHSEVLLALCHCRLYGAHCLAPVPST